MRTSNDAALILTERQSAAVSALSLVDMFFRCAPFAIPAVPWAASLSDTWRHTFSPFLLTVRDATTYIAAVATVGVALLLVAWKGTRREDTLFGDVHYHHYQPKQQAAPQPQPQALPQPQRRGRSTVGSASVITTVSASSSTSAGPPDRASHLSILGVTAARLLEGAHPNPPRCSPA